MIELETLPKGWTIANFNECCENISLNGIKVKQKQYLASGKFPVIDQGRELIGGYFNDDLLVVPNEPPYIVFGDHTKVKKFVTFKFIAGADGVKVLKPYDFILPKLFYYFIHAVKMPDKGYARHYQFLASEKFPIPPFNEQKRILAKLEQLLTDLDKGIEYLETVKQQLKVYRHAVLKWAFEGNWETKPLGEVAIVKRGKSKHRPRNAPELFGGKYPFIQTGDVRAANGRVVNKYTETYSEFGLKQSKLWPKGTLCLTIAANIADTAFLGFDACFPDSVVGITSEPNILNLDYVNFYIQKIKQEIEGKASATAQKNINVEFLEALEIPVPNPIKQLKIVHDIESRLSVCEKIEETIESSLQQAEALRLSIIKKAFEGKIVPQDPNDEPAEKLLERIRAAKGNEKPEKKEKVKSEKKVKTKKVAV